MHSHVFRMDDKAAHFAYLLGEFIVQVQLSVKCVSVKEILTESLFANVSLSDCNGWSINRIESKLISL